MSLSGQLITRMLFKKLVNIRLVDKSTQGLARVGEIRTYLRAERASERLQLTSFSMTIEQVTF